MGLFILVLMCLATFCISVLCPFDLFSGDVTAHRAIIQASLGDPSCRRQPLSLTAWTRVIVFRDVNQNNVTLSRKQQVNSYHGLDPRKFPGNYVAKVFLKSLQPDSTYYYKFFDEHGRSLRLGSFKTLPLFWQRRNVHFVHISCANRNPYPVSKALAKYVQQTKPNFAIFNGDVVYSDRFWVTDSNYTSENRCCQKPIPSLDYFRSLYSDQRDAEYTGLGFPKFLRSLPVFVAIDDHSVVNNYAGQDGDPRAIDIEVGSNDPVQILDIYPPEEIQVFYTYGIHALLEMNGITAGRDLQRDDFAHGLRHEERRTFRKFSVGRDVEVFILDLRQYRDIPMVARGFLPVRPKGTSPDFLCTPRGDPVLCSVVGNNTGTQSNFRSVNKTILGSVQKSWLKKGLANSKAKFKFVVSSVVISEMFLTPSDRWEGYWNERKEVLSFIEEKYISNVVFLAGDVHSSIFSQVNPGRKPEIYEFSTGPVGKSTQGSLLGPISENIVKFIAKYAGNAHLLRGNVSAIKFLNFDEPNFMSVQVRGGSLIIKCLGMDGKVVYDKLGNKGVFKLP